MRGLAFVAVALLSSCAWGVTSADFSGDICGSPVMLNLKDGKARQGFKLHAQCDESRWVQIESLESTVEGQQAASEVVANSFATVNTLIDRLGPLWTGPRLVVPGSGE